MPHVHGAALLACLVILLHGGALSRIASAQPVPQDLAQQIEAQRGDLEAKLVALRANADLETSLPDVEIFAKAAEWIVRHEEFYRPEYGAWTLDALKLGLDRAGRLAAGLRDWEITPGKKHVLGYRSHVDDSVQPMAVTLPRDFDAKAERRWPLHVVLHGRDARLNEISFIHAHEGRAAPAEQDWIQLDIFGRTNNAYRWAGEADVLEALADVRRRYRIDERRIVLHGFSMGGAGSWHLGLHYPSLWCSVGPGAGFVDFYKYQKITTPLPPWQDRALHIYNAVDYALNAFNVPVCTYGGELDEQLAASKEMAATAEKLGVPIKVLIGPKTGHKFHPETHKEFMAFHREQQNAGRRAWGDLRQIRFSTWTLKYNNCDWLTVEEQLEPLRESAVEARVDDETGVLFIKTTNVAVLQIARDVADTVDIDGTSLALRDAAQGLLPGVYFETSGTSWRTLSYEASLGFPKNIDHRKRHNLQGPIDDAFMQPFVCVVGTGTPWNSEHEAWARWTLERFQSEFDKWFRGKVPVVRDTEVTPELFLSKNLIVFGDPGSNSILAKTYKQLPIRWRKELFEVRGESYDPAKHGLSLIYPNPLAPRRYLVVNSGHTFHAEDFKRSNAWLFPRLGDIAVQRFAKNDSGGYTEETLWADFFDSNWTFSEKPSSP